MLHVWLRAQHSSLAVWQADAKQWQLVDDWQQLQEHYISYKSGNDKRLCLYFPSSHLLQVDTELSLNQLKQLGDLKKRQLPQSSS